jgi:hypothetical protein
MSALGVASNLLPVLGGPPGPSQSLVAGLQLLNYCKGISGNSWLTEMDSKQVQLSREFYDIHLFLYNLLGFNLLETVVKISPFVNHLIKLIMIC